MSCKLSVPTIARLLLGSNCFGFFAHNCTYLMFDHCTASCILWVFLRNVLKMFMLEENANTGKDDSTRVIFYVLCFICICPFDFLYILTRIIFVLWIVTKCPIYPTVAVTAYITIPHFICLHQSLKSLVNLKNNTFFVYLHTSVLPKSLWIIIKKVNISRPSCLGNILYLEWLGLFGHEGLP